MREKFTPLARRAHMIDNFAAKDFVFLDREGFIEDAMMFVIMEANASETIDIARCAKITIQ